MMGDIQAMWPPIVNGNGMFPTVPCHDAVRHSAVNQDGMAGWAVLRLGSCCADDAQPCA